MNDVMKMVDKLEKKLDKNNLKIVYQELNNTILDEYFKNFTVKQIKGRECLAKNCWHLQKNENHEWWAQRKRTKDKRNTRKEKIKMMIGDK